MHPLFTILLVGAACIYVMAGVFAAYGTETFKRRQYNTYQDEIRWMDQWKQALLWPFLLYVWETCPQEVGYVSRETAWQAQILLTERDCSDADYITEGHLPTMSSYRELGGGAFNVTAHYGSS